MTRLPPGQTTSEEHEREQEATPIDLDRMLRHWPIILLAILIVAFSFISPGFLSRDNWIATSVYTSALLLIAVGQMVVMLGGGIDLSMAGTAAFCGMLGALFLERGGLEPSGAGAVALCVLTCVLSGALIGSINGLLIARLGLAPFIVTLGMLSTLTGAVQIVGDGQFIEVRSTALLDFGSLAIGGWVPYVVLLSAVITLTVGVMLARTSFGMRTYAIGSNPEAVRRLGIPTVRIITLNYIMAGALGGIAGFVLISRFAQATTAVDTTGMLTAIAAVVIGGTSLFGGVGTMWGTVVGVSIVSVLLPGLVLSGLSSYWQTFVSGLIIIVAVFVERVRSGPAVGRSLGRKRRRSAAGGGTGTDDGTSGRRKFQSAP